MEPKPFQKPHPPIWFGANHPAALRRAARHGDGFFGAGSTTTARFAEQVTIVREALAQAGRDPASFRIAKRVYIHVDDDAERARRRVADGLHQLYADFGIAASRRSRSQVRRTRASRGCARSPRRAPSSSSSPRSSTSPSRWSGSRRR
jgi:alkanesulfonate monooxygenase SsuD/methylene tetrahydromethanopterin reductase-like flavin-dependent oxidoreductase (luciferase family)